MGRLSTDRRPRLGTERLRLEPLTTEHTELLVELDSDPEVLRFIFGRALTREESLRWAEVRLDPQAGPRGLGTWAGFEGDSFCGWWTLQLDGRDSDTAELGYRLRRDHWGRGLATEGAVALLSHGFETVGLERIWAQTMAVNAPSRDVMTRIGMTFERTWVGEWNDPLPGWEDGEVEYAITRPEWRVMRSRQD